MYDTPQEEFWAGNFGNDYISRNNDDQLIASNCVLFSKVLSNTKGIKSVIEFGSNIGLNLIALKRLIPGLNMSAIEINNNAVEILKQNINNLQVYPTSIFDFEPDFKRELTFTKGVLIHINPDKLQDVYQKLYDSSSKYILIAEYYNPSPVTIVYRGHTDRLFKRDFAGEFMDKYPDLSIVNYGFAYHRDSNFPQDDFTWFLLTK